MEAQAALETKAPTVELVELVDGVEQVVEEEVEIQAPLVEEVVEEKSTPAFQSPTATGLNPAQMGIHQWWGWALGENENPPGGHKTDAELVTMFLRTFPNRVKCQPPKRFRSWYNTGEYAPAGTAFGGIKGTYRAVPEVKSVCYDPKTAPVAKTPKSTKVAQTPEAPQTEILEGMGITAAS